MASEEELYDAVMAGNESEVLRIIAAGADVNARDPSDGKTPLYGAIIGGSLGVVQALILHGAKADICLNNGLTPLHKAAEDGQEEMVKILLEAKAKVNTEYNVKNEPLHKPEMVLLRKDNTRETPLHAAAANGNGKVISLLIRAGGDIECMDHENRRPLHLAAKYGLKDAVISLIEGGAKLNEKDTEGNTPLHLAAMCFYDRIDPVIALIQAGASFTELNHSCMTAREAAAKCKNWNIAKILSNPQK